MKTNIRFIPIFVLYLLLQVFLFNKMTLANLATPHVFLLFLLMLPLNMPFWGSILTGFTAGLLVDVFSSNLTTGLHAFSCVLMMAVRMFWVDIITNRNAWKGSEEQFLESQPVTWYVNFLAPLIFLHHLTYFFLEAFGFQNFGNTLLKLVLSFLFTFAATLLGTLLFYKKRSKRQ